MAIPILHLWKKYFTDPDEGLGSSYERVILNHKIESICRNVRAKRVLEAPSFGFTGTSGINSMALARAGFDITIVDHDSERAELIRGVWKNLDLDVEVCETMHYSKLPFEDGAFDVSWNFSALWFVEDIEAFLAEISRVTAKAVMLCVPNRWGVGYLSQKYGGKDDLKRYLKEDHIKPRTFDPIMKKLGWTPVDRNFIDCPPWPDIGMPKAKFLQKFGLGFLVKEEKPEPITILDFFSGKDPLFEEKMLRYAWFERLAPWIVKRFWAHHRYVLYLKDNHTVSTLKRQ